MPGVTYLSLSDTPKEFCVGMAMAVPRNLRNALVSNVMHYVQKHHQTQEMQLRGLS